MKDLEGKLGGTPEPMPVGRWTINRDKCTTCCDCIDVCPRGLLCLEENVVVIKNEYNCNQCGECADICGYKAIILT